MEGRRYTSQLLQNNREVVGHKAVSRHDLSCSDSAFVALSSLAVGTSELILQSLHD